MRLRFRIRSCAIASAARSSGTGAIRISSTPRATRWKRRAESWASRSTSALSCSSGRFSRTRELRTSFTRWPPSTVAVCAWSSPVPETRTPHARPWKWLARGWVPAQPSSGPSRSRACPRSSPPPTWWSCPSSAPPRRAGKCRPSSSTPWRWPNPSSPRACPTFPLCSTGAVGWSSPIRPRRSPPPSARCSTIRYARRRWRRPQDESASPSTRGMPWRRPSRTFLNVSAGRTENMNDLVSVILPTYNRAHVLGRAIASVLAQTHQSLELIVVDDGSTDDTAAVLDAITHDRLRVIRLDANRGASCARNRGIAVAQGALVAFIDSDDVWTPDKLARQTAALTSRSDRVGLCVCSMEVDRDGARHRVQYQDEELDSNTAVTRIISGVGMGTPSWLARRDTLQAVGGFDESLPRMQDYECALRIAQEWRIILMSDVMVLAEVGADSISASAERYVRAIGIIIDRHRPLFERRRDGYSEMIFRAGKYLALEGRYREAIPWFVRAFRIRPTNARALIGAVLCATGLFPLFRRMKYAR